MFDIILHQPEIPQNTGNIIRLCANTGAQLHLVKPLGFVLRDRQLRRAGLDYHEFTTLKIHDNWEACLQAVAAHRLYAVTTKGKTRYDTVIYAEGDALLFGSETRGLPPAVMESIDASRRIRLPMVPASRSLNLSNAVAVVLYEAWRQTGFQAGN